MFLALTLACSGSSTGFQKVDPDVENEVGESEATFYPDPIVFENAVPTVSIGQFVKITNVGENTLTVYRISVSDAAGGQFDTEAVTEFSLEPTGSREWQVTCTLSADKSAVGELRVETSAENALDARLPLTCHPFEGDSGDSGA